MKNFKVHGCRHSGTRYMIELIALNWHARNTTDFGDRHGESTGASADVPVIVVHKHPAAYLASVRERAWGQERSIDWLLNDWEEMHRKWLKVARASVKYEDLLFDFENTMSGLDRVLRADRKHKEYKNIAEYVGCPEREVRRFYYQTREYFQNIPAEGFRRVFEIPSDLMTRLGYEE